MKESNSTRFDVTAGRAINYRITPALVINGHFCFCRQGDSPFGKSEAYIKLEQLGEGSYATVYKGYSK